MRISDWSSDVCSSDLLHLRCLVIGQPARPQPERLHQRAVDDEIGIAPDRRGEMRVTAEREPKMAVIGGRVIGLRLAAQHLFHHLRLEIGIADAREDMVEGRGLDHLSQRELEIEGLEIILERDQLLAARRSEEHTSELQSLMRISYAVFCLKKKKNKKHPIVKITYAQQNYRINQQPR